MPPPVQISTPGRIGAYRFNRKVGVGLRLPRDSVRLNSNEDYGTKKFENVNLIFEADHTSVVISKLDDGPFVKDSSDL